MDPLSSPRARRAPVVLLAPALALALALATGCTAPAPTTASPAPTTRAAPTAPGAVAPPAEEDALADCARGSCEIRVDGPATIPIAADTGVSELRVLAVDADGIELVAVVPGGQVSTRCSGPCAGMRTSASGGESSVRLTAGAGAVIGVNGVSVDVRSAVPGAADLRLTPR
ncbi:hypothetical protein ACL02T_26140 [Pseudonocardia sp. RS010]|uniref:hypothetical protein n=1 Tax=Pseudonocardia sp. RS010 TaxID=3385979 RepID=UPI0039A087C5